MADTGKVALITLDCGYHSEQFDRVTRDNTETGTGTSVRVYPDWLEDSAKRLGNSRFDNETRRGYDNSSSRSGRGGLVRAE